MTTANDLRQSLVDTLHAQGSVSDPRVEQALRTVPRELFLPGEDLETAYANRNISIKNGPDGECLSSASTPGVVGMMLQQLDAPPGARVLEVGAGTGYNATLLSQLVGSSGSVTAVDIDPDAVAHAHQALERAETERVQLLQGDGEKGAPEQAPFDRIIVTAGSWDLPDAWWDQLVEGGLLVVPLRFRGMTRSVAFRREGDRMASVSAKLCGFIPMRNDDGEHDLDLGGGVSIRYDEDQNLHAETLAGALDTSPVAEWSGVMVGSEPIHGIWGRLASIEAGTCRIIASAEAVESARARPAIPSLSPALVEGASLAYLTHRRAEGAKESELGALGHGPAGADLCARLVAQVHAWDGGDREDRLAITAARTRDALDALPGKVIAKRTSTLIVQAEDR